jgi:hypothetical protein
MQKRPLGATYIVMDRGLVAKALVDAVAQRFHGSLRAGVLATNALVERQSRRKAIAPAGRPSWLPAATTVDYTTAMRARNQKTNRLKGSTFSWLILFVGPEHSGRLEQAVISPLAQRLLESQAEWESATFQRMAIGDRSSVLRAAVAARGGRSDRVDLLLAEMLRANRDAFQRFHDHTAAHCEQRTNLAWLQLVRPFLDAPQGLERSWEEMSQADRKEYVRLTLRREELLLDRLPDVQRAQEVAESLRQDLSSWSKLGVPPLG